jgi:hypothetical protein
VHVEDVPRRNVAAPQRVIAQPRQAPQRQQAPARRPISSMSGGNNHHR